MHAVMQIARLSDGTRKVITISEVTGMDGESIAMQDIFHFDRTGIDENGQGARHISRHRDSPSILPSGWRLPGARLRPALFESRTEI